MLTRKVEKMIPHPTILENDHVILRPLEVADVEALRPAAEEPEIWRYMRIGSLDTPERLRAWVEGTVQARSKGTEYPFVTVQRSTGLLAGSTRFWNLDAANRSLEIGSTWLGRDFRRTAINTSAKLLMLKFAFESLQCIRVQLRTDLRNERSQRAIERIGAQREGVFRKDFIYPDGYQRSSVFYSITDEEWPNVKRKLVEMLSHYQN
jgi:RimJ/RimL family protein N-acetyltransferase